MKPPRLSSGSGGRANRDRGKTTGGTGATLVAGMTFTALALYVTSKSVTKLILHEQPTESLIGILLTIVSPVMCQFS